MLYAKSNIFIQEQLNYSNHLFKGIYCSVTGLNMCRKKDKSEIILRKYK